MIGVSYLCGFGNRVLAAAQAGAASMSSIKTVTPAYLLSESAVILRSLIGWTTPEDIFGITQTVALIVAVVAMAVLYLRCRHRPFDFLVGASLAFALGSPAFREWYLLMWISFVGLVKLGPWMQRTVSVLLPFAGVYSAFKSYLAWDIIPAFCASGALAVASNASGWLVGRAGDEAATCRRQDGQLESPPAPDAPGLALPEPSAHA